MLAVKISIKKNLSCSICELSPVIARDIVHFTKYLIAYMFRPIPSLMTVQQMDFLGIDLTTNSGMVHNKNDQLVL